MCIHVCFCSPVGIETKHPRIPIAEQGKTTMTLHAMTNSPCGGSPLVPMEFEGTVRIIHSHVSASNHPIENTRTVILDTRITDKVSEFYLSKRKEKFHEFRYVSRKFVSSENYFLSCNIISIACDTSRFVSFDIWKKWWINRILQSRALLNIFAFVFNDTWHKIRYCFRRPYDLIWIKNFDSFTKHNELYFPDVLSLPLVYAVYVHSSWSELNFPRL